MIHLYSIDQLHLTGDGGCAGGKDIWGFVWPIAVNEETVNVPCPNGQGM